MSHSSEISQGDYFLPFLRKLSYSLRQSETVDDALVLRKTVRVRNNISQLNSVVLAIGNVGKGGRGHHGVKGNCGFFYVNSAKLCKLGYMRLPTL